MEQTPKKQFKIDLFQTARIHTEQFVEEFDTEDEAKARAQAICEEKGIIPDFEVNEIAPEPTSVESPVSEAPEGIGIPAATPVAEAPVADTTVQQQ